MKINLRSHHIALRITDYARARQFYTEVLELPVVGQIPGKEIEFLGIGGTTIELMGGADPESLAKPQAGLIHLAFEVEDVDAEFERDRELAEFYAERLGQLQDFFRLAQLFLVTLIQHAQEQPDVGEIKRIDFE